MIKSAQAKLIGRAMIRDHKGLIAGCFGLFYLISIALSGLSIFFEESLALILIWTILSGFLTVPISLGLYRVLNRIYFRQPAQIGDLFYFFQNYSSVLKAVGVGLIYSLILSVFTAIVSAMVFGGTLIGAGILSAGGGTLEGYIGGMASSLFFIFLITVILGVILSCVQISSWMLVLRSPDITFGQLLALSFQIGLRYAWRYFCFTLSFIGWALLMGVLVAVFLTVSFFLPPLALLVLPVMFVGILALAVYQVVSSVAFFNSALDDYASTHPDSIPSRPDFTDFPQ